MSTAKSSNSMTIWPTSTGASSGSSVTSSVPDLPKTVNLTSE